MFKHSTLALALLAGALSGAAGAQDKDTKYPAKPSEPGKQTTPANPSVSSSPAGPARASDVIGTELVDASNNTIGEIDDLIIGKDNVVCALVDRKDGGLGAIPLDKLQPRMEAKPEPNTTPEVDQFVVADTARLQSAPALKDRDAMTAEWLKSTCDHYKGDGKTGMDPARPEGDRVAHAAEKPACAKKLIGKELEASDGDDVGEIQDLALDLKSGKVSYAILSVGGVLGMGEKHHAVALDKLTMSGDKFKVPATKQELKDKAGIDLAHLPSGPNLMGTAR